LKKAVDSLSIYKSFYRLAKTNFKTDFSVDSNGKDGRTVSINIPTDSLEIYRKLYQLAQRDYGIKYKVEEKDGFIYYTGVITKADSALDFFNAFRDHIRYDSNQVWFNRRPKKKK